MLENFGDTPFYPGRVPASVVAGMTHLAGEVCRRFDVPLGINVLRNDGRSALAIALAVGAAFIRVNVLCGARVTDQGVIQGIAHKLLRDRVQLGAQHIRILADVNVKHSAPLGLARPIEDEAADLLHRGGADALIVSGGGTGQPASPDNARRAKAVAGDAPVLVGSGVTPESIRSFLPHADGFIVGTALKVGRIVGHPVDPERVTALLRASVEQHRPRVARPRRPCVCAIASQTSPPRAVDGQSPPGEDTPRSTRAARPPLGRSRAPSAPAR